MRYLIFLFIVIGQFTVFCQSSNETQQLIRQGQYELALAKLNQTELDTVHFKDLATCEYYLGEWAKSKEHFLSYLNKFPNDETALLQLARIYDQESNYPKAIKYYSKLLAESPNNVNYLKRSAALHMKSGEDAIGRVQYETAYALRPTDIVLAKDLAEYYLKIDSIALADTIILEGLENNPDHVGINLIAAQLKFKIKEFDQSIKYYEHARQSIDLNMHQRKLLGYAYLQVDSLDKAIYELENIIHSDEGEAIHYYLALAYFKKEDLNKSLFHYDKAIEKSVSRRVDLYCMQASSIAREQNNLKLALEYATLAHDFTDNPTYYYDMATLSDLYYKDKNVAIRYYNLYVKNTSAKSEKRDYAMQRATYLRELLHQKR